MAITERSKKTNFALPPLGWIQGDNLL